MKAIVFYQHGGLDVLQQADIPAPTPGPNDVLVQVHYCALNRLDLFVREGWKGLELKMPHVLGADVAGTIAATGSQVTGWQVGQRVVVNGTLSCGRCEYCRRGDDHLCVQHAILGEHTPGGYAEYVAVPAANVLPVPEGFPLAEAAAASLVFLTAWRMLVGRAQVCAGEDVLVVGAGGGVNSAAIQIAHLAGARVFAVASNAEKGEKARALGADVVIDRSRENWSRAVWQQTNKRGVDVVVDNVGAATFFDSIRALAKGGRLVTVGNSSGPKTELDIRYVWSKQISILGSTMGSRDDFATVMALVFAGKLRAVVDRILPLAAAREAQALLERGEQFGKIVLKVADEA
ncbi:MAG: zinc-binding dehydrogenase [Anaerolineae bacterium]|nr:zinc-binding dehydrogenase [Anaerolineae bacterium]